jgi:hypothetical protein
VHSRQFLKKVLEIQIIYRAHKREEVTSIGIFRIHIRDKYFCSERTFYRYLEIPAAKLLKDMGEAKPPPQ